MNAKAGPAELGRKKRHAREVERSRRLGVAQLAGYDEVTRAQFRREAARHADKRDGRLLVEIRGKLGAGTPGASGPGADDDIGAAHREGFDTQRRQNLEISRGLLRSRNAPGP